MEKAKWIFAALRIRPLDRIRLMKALFLTWKRSGGNIPGFFQFEPYLYGPCSFELYRVLRELEEKGLIVQPPHPIQQWAKYYLTERGKEKADSMSRHIDTKILERLKQAVDEVADLDFYKLLAKVYKEAPEFAINSVVKGILDK